MDSKIENKDSYKSCDKPKKGSGNKISRKEVDSPKSSSDSSRKSTPNSINELDQSASPYFSEDGHQSDGDLTDSKPIRRQKQVQLVSLNLKSKNNPLNPDKILQGILPGGKANIFGGEAGQTSKEKEEETLKQGEGNSEEKKSSSRTNSPKTLSKIDEEFRQKIKRMDYNTVYMMAQRTKGPQQYKYRKILQEMYDEQNK